jgi:protein gp37
MATQSKIEWTEHTWNPIVGCSIVSPGCTNCYAMKMAARIEAMAAASKGAHGAHYAGATKKVNGNAVWTGKLRQAPDDVLLAALRCKKPTTYFVNSMGDLFHEDCPDEWIDKVFAVMALCPHHTFQVLTKRAERMRGYLSDDKMHRRFDVAMVNILADAPYARLPVPITDENYRWPLPGVWLGVSAENQDEWEERKRHLKNTPATIKFASFEPLLGPIVDRSPLSIFINWAS